MATEHEYITLVSEEGFEYIVLREAAMISPVLRSMLSPDSAFIESRTGRCCFDDMTGEVVEKVAEYLVYWYRYKDRDDVPEMTMRPEICLEVLRAADFLGLDDSSAPGINP